MVSDAITRYRLDDDSTGPNLVQAIKDSAASLYSGKYHLLLHNVHMFYSFRLTSLAAVETVCLIFFLWDHQVTYGRQSNATLVTFVYLMMNHPEIQRHAQAEIDRVVGRQRLPDFEDRLSLPYVDAVLRETMRRHPVAPIGTFNTNARTPDPLRCPRCSSCHDRRRYLSRVSHPAR